jgi:hypothetical protein
MSDGYSHDEIVRWLQRHDAALEESKFVRDEDYEADDKLNDRAHIALNGRADKNEKRIDKLDFRVNVVLGGLAAGVLSYAGIVTKGLFG